MSSCEMVLCSFIDEEVNPGKLSNQPRVMTVTKEKASFEPPQWQVEIYFIETEFIGCQYGE